jgi:glutamyl-tRNA reductase
MSLRAYELTLTDEDNREELVQALRRQTAPLLVLDTCQRLEVYTHGETALESLPVSQRWEDAMAFERLARIAAGLESRILGELEILGQVRTAYRIFRQGGGGPEQDLDGLFQQALALARKARRRSGIDQKMTSLSGLAARELLRRIEPGVPLAVVGSGALAGSAARYLGKRGQSPVRVSSRCPDNAVNLAMQVGGFGSGLDDLQHLLNDVGGILTATAAPHPLLFAHHLEATRRPLHIVDLGVPADCSDEVRALGEVDYTSLEEIEARASTNVAEREQRGETAARIIREGAIAWARRR